MLEPATEASCPKCGHTNKGAKFCDQCGTRLPVRCGSCGHTNIDAKFCDRCGNPLVGAAAANPYAAPSEDSAAPTGDPQLASRGARLGASLIDSLCVSIVNIPLLRGAGLLPMDGRMPGLRDGLVAGVIGFVVFAAMQGWFLANGQTIGKRLLGLRIVDVEDGEPPSIAHTLGLRYLPTTIAAALGVIGSVIVLFDALLIFSSDRRCLHDRIASTKVVKV
ncbi:MAG TPA: RDD family protein [Nannocystaceae bacterium]|nr:RDD family protein [Nannocystaceae bacterium]